MIGPPASSYNAVFIEFLCHQCRTVGCTMSSVFRRSAVRHNGVLEKKLVLSLIPWWRCSWSRPVPVVRPLCVNVTKPQIMLVPIGSFWSLLLE